jgi:hypothetical protein
MSELYHQATLATMQHEADLLMEACVVACERAGRSREDAEEIARDGIGFFAAKNCDDATRERVYRLYRTEDPLERARRRSKGHATQIALGSDSDRS